VRCETIRHFRFNGMIDPDSSRQTMVDAQLRARGISDKRVLQAMARVPRERFISSEHRPDAYVDHPLPIGYGQTISQPYVVAVMLESLQLKPGDKTLEIGTGSGYATALLAELTTQVFSIERHAELADTAREVLISLGYTNAKVFGGDGTLGLPAIAPFDAILVSAAAPNVPAELLAQLAEGGRMIIPVGTEDSQQLQLVQISDGRPIISPRELVRFVPLISDRRW
jgi:protein-L-isoaspartate(D-aspartate) O-methyltransferase